MRKTLLIVSMLLGWTALAVAGPKLLIPQTHWDLGRVPQNTSVSHIFWIKNVGDDTLKGISVKPG